MGTFAPQRSIAGAAVPSMAWARTHKVEGEPGPDPPGSVMYLACSRRRRIWKLVSNPANPVFPYRIDAERGPLWADTVNGPRSTMGEIDGGLFGAWYIEAPAQPTQPNGPPRVALGIPFDPTGLFTPTLHRLNPDDLSLVASYVFQYYVGESQSFNTGPYLVAPPAVGVGGNSGSLVYATSRVNIAIGIEPNRVTLNLPGGLFEVSLGSLLGICDTVTNGTTIGGLIRVLYGEDEALATSSQASEVIPLPGFETMLNGATTAKTVGGKSGMIYATDASGVVSGRWIARWDSGALTAYKTAANASAQDFVEAQHIGGSSGVCYTTANNDRIIIRDGALNKVAEYTPQQIQTVIPPTPNPAGGFITGFTFTGIGGS